MIINRALPRDGNRSFSITTAPSIEPITLTELKDFGRIDGSDEDTLLTGFIVAARQACENYLGRALIEQTISMRMDFWPDGLIELPRPPLLLITTVKTVDDSNTETVYASTNYYVMTTGLMGTIAIRDDATPPYNYDRQYGGFLVTYQAGYGSTAASVPQVIRDGVKLWAMDIYENRVVRDEPPPEAISLLKNYRIRNF
jgi:uncharacterized phiE125 gp8 family phage protein